MRGVIYPDYFWQLFCKGTAPPHPVHMCSPRGASFPPQPALTSMQVWGGRPLGGHLGAVPQRVPHVPPLIPHRRAPSQQQSRSAQTRLFIAWAGVDLDEVGDNQVIFRCRATCSAGSGRLCPTCRGMAGLWDRGQRQGMARAGTVPEDGAG